VRSDTIVIVPARLGSTRLPNKPLKDICGKPMLIHVMERAAEARVGEVLAAVAEKQVSDVVSASGYKAVLTNPDLPSGSDRIYEAYKGYQSNADYIINLQGDLPNVSPELICAIVDELKKSDADIVTAAVKIIDEEQIHNPNIVKAVIGLEGRALYFTRSACPYSAKDYYHHIGIYGYKRDALAKFISLPVSPLEETEKLEQLRALENGMKVKVVITDEAPIGVDTAADLNLVRELLKSS
jgi:3-deoxy-manno-octulosonate cytidylyltransferase (CMP-KDO synthetase)